MEAIKAQLSKLREQREALESQIAERTDRLNAPGQPGMQGSLIDKEGYPRADIDVHAVRLDRNAVICMTNDHKAVTQQMEQLLYQLHALARESGAHSSSNGSAQAAGVPPAAAAAADTRINQDSSTPQRRTGAQPASSANGSMPRSEGDLQPPVPAMGRASIPLNPFAVVDEVAEESPAAAAGIQLGDQLCKFGEADGSTSDALQQVAQQLQQHENRPVQAVFLRAGQAVQLELVPQRWGGRGLLGCHLRPL